MKKWFTTLLVLTFIFALFGIPVSAEEEDVKLAEHSKSAILMEKHSGEVIYQKNPHEKLPPASMTKIMTMLLVMEALEKGAIELDETVRISEYAASMGGSQIYLEAGEEMSVEDLLKAVAVASGNDAAVALAERVAGSEDAFVKMMNDRAKELGLENTRFQNSTGLPAKQHYSTAYDMAVMAKELLKYDEITKYTSIYDDYLRKGTDDEFWLVNTNKLVKFYEGVDGLKTGYTDEAKYCLTATAHKDNMRVIAVVMGAETPKQRTADITNMLDYVFQQYEAKPIYKKHETVDTIKLLKAKKENIDVVTRDDVSILLKKGEKMDNLKKSIEYKGDLTLPIKKGQPVGMLTISNKEKVILKTPLIINENVEKAGVWDLMKRSMKRFVKNS